MSQNNKNKGKKMSEDNTNTNNNCPKSTNNQLQRRLVIVTGDKGGVGKSTFARGLLQLYINKDLRCISYEADHRNPQLERHYKNKYEPLVGYVDVFSRGGLDDLLIQIENNKETSIFMLDLPAQSGGFLEGHMKELSFFETIKDVELDCRVTMVSVISRVLDSVNVLEKLYDSCEDRVDYIVVKNLFHGDVDKFERYNDSPFRNNMKGKSLTEVIMPDMFYKPYDFIDVHGLTFNDALTHKDTNIAIKARVRSWLENFEESLKPVSSLLGLDKIATPGYYKEMADITEVKKRKEEAKKREEEAKKQANKNSVPQQSDSQQLPGTV